MGHHADVPGLQDGWIGVDLFFVLSGFLITTILINELSASGELRFRAFYARRTRRLAPALTLLLIVTFPIAVILFDPKPRGEYLAALPIVLLYTTNWVIAATHHGLSMFSHTWSLGIEEQFYLLWPVSLRWLWCRSSAIGAARSVLIVAAAVAIWRVPVAVFWSGSGVEYRFDTRADSLLIGAAAALLLAGGALDGERCRRAIRLAVMVLPILTLCLLVVGRLEVQVRGDIDALRAIMIAGGYDVFAILAAALVLYVGLDRDSRTTRMLSYRGLVWVGRISYGLYLWDFAILYMQNQFLPRNVRRARPLSATWVAVTVGHLALTFAAAILSYYLVERRFLRRSEPADRDLFRVGGAGVCDEFGVAQPSK
jgi:peptidoglycan/LPS O-acetylase OafA/YrhL